MDTYSVYGTKSLYIDMDTWLLFTAKDKLITGEGIEERWFKSDYNEVEV